MADKFNLAKSSDSCQHRFVGFSHPERILSGRACPALWPLLTNQVSDCRVVSFGYRPVNHNEGGGIMKPARVN